MQREPETGVDRYLLGADAWMHTDSLRSGGSERVRFWLGAPGPDGICTLDLQPPEETGTVTFRHDPTHLVCSHGGESLLRTREEAGSLLQKGPQTDEYTVCCLSEPVNFAGPLRVRLHVSSNVEIDIICWEIAYRFQKGSRIRLDITSSDSPQYAVHNNFAGEWAEQSKYRTAQQTVFYGGRSRSFLEFPCGGN